MRSHPVPNVGDTVILNDFGLDQIFGSHEALQHMKTLRMKITGVAELSMTSPEETFAVEVDNKAISMYMIDHWCFDIVEKVAIAPKYERWGTSSGREGIQRTLVSSDVADTEFLKDGILIFDAGSSVGRSPTVEEAEQMGIRRIVAAKDIHTGEMKHSERTPMMVIPAGSTTKNHVCTYSRSINQSFPRKCRDCGEPEPERGVPAAPKPLQPKPASYGDTW